MKVIDFSLYFIDYRHPILTNHTPNHLKCFLQRLMYEINLRYTVSKITRTCEFYTYCLSVMQVIMLFLQLWPSLTSLMSQWSSDQDVVEVSE